MLVNVLSLSLSVSRPPIPLSLFVWTCCFVRETHSDAERSICLRKHQTRGASTVLDVPPEERNRKQHMADVRLRFCVKDNPKHTHTHTLFTVDVCSGVMYSWRLHMCLVVGVFSPSSAVHSPHSVVCQSGEREEEVIIDAMPH